MDYCIIVFFCHRCHKLSLSWLFETLKNAKNAEHTCLKYTKTLFAFSIFCFSTNHFGDSGKNMINKICKIPTKIFTANKNLHKFSFPNKSECAINAVIKIPTQTVT